MWSNFKEFSVLCNWMQIVQIKHRHLGALGVSLLASSAISFTVFAVLPGAAVCWGFEKLPTDVLKWWGMAKCFIWWDFKCLTRTWKQIKIQLLEWVLPWASWPTFLTEVAPGRAGMMARLLDRVSQDLPWNLSAFALEYWNNLKLASVYVEHVGLFGSLGDAFQLISLAVGVRPLSVPWRGAVVKTCR